MSINIAHISQLANLPIAKPKEEKLKKQLEETLIYIKRLNEINTDNIEPTSQVTGLENITREDIVTPSLSQEDALRNAKTTYNGFFIVKAVLEE